MERIRARAKHVFRIQGNVNSFHLHGIVRLHLTVKPLEKWSYSMRGRSRAITKMSSENSGKVGQGSQAANCLPDSGAALAGGSMCKTTDVDGPHPGSHVHTQR